MLKNKPLMIGVMAVIALLIAGGIYFFVIRDDDSATDADADTSTDGSEEPGTDTGSGIEDDGSAVLVAKGFDCQTTTVAAEAQAQIVWAQAAAADPNQLLLTQLQASLIDESEIADNEVLDCNHAGQQIDVLVASIADADVYMGIRVQAICTISTNQGVPAEALEGFIQDFKSSFEADPEAFVINSKAYFASSSSAEETQTSSAQKQLGALLEEAEAVEYTSYALPDGLACA